MLSIFPNIKLSHAFFLLNNQQGDF